MKKKGFTLIELLAVIVILAIIALIATPAVLNIIEKSRIASIKESTRGIARAAETHYAKQVMNGSTIVPIDLTGDILRYDGKKPEKGKVYFNGKGKAYIKMYYDEYCVEREFNGTITLEKTLLDECIITNGENGEIIPTDELPDENKDMTYDEAKDIFVFDTNEDGEIYITGLTGIGVDMSKIIIPDTIGG